VSPPDPPRATDAHRAELRRGRALLAQARSDSRQWSRAFVSSLLATVDGGGAGADRPARQRRAAEVAEEFAEAADAFRAALGIRASREAYVGIAEALDAQGGTYAAMGPGAEGDAIASLSGAVDALDGALGLGSLGSRSALLDMKVRLLRFAAGIWSRIAEWGEAAACYRDAVAAVNDLIALAPGDAEARLSKATLLGAWAALGVRHGSPAYSPRLPADPEASLARHREALAAFDAAMASTHHPGPQRGLVTYRTSVELRSLGDLQRAMPRRRSALESYRAAVRLLDEVVAEQAGQRSERGRMLQRVADVARELGRPTEAVWAYERGIADLRETELPGGYDDLARGTMLMQLGELYLSAGRIEEARGCLQEGLEVLLASAGIVEDDKLARDRLIHRGRELLHG